MQVLAKMARPDGKEIPKAYFDFHEQDSVKATFFI